MATVSSNSKVGFIYDEATDTWYPMAGLASTLSDYAWTGNHSFANDVTFTDVVLAKAGINNFANPTARDAAIASPSNGTVVFIRQDNSGNTINQIQYYSTTASAWVNYYDAQFSNKTTNYVLAIGDSGKTITMNSSSANTVTVPANASVAFPIGTIITFFQTGTGETSFVESAGVTINSKGSRKKINAQYCGAQLIKLDTNSWLLAGDIKA
jgi:hypothetical protein